MNETILGMKPTTVIYLLLILVALLVITTIIIINKMNVISRKYYSIMSGKKGADLEKIIRIRFKEMDQVKANAKTITKEHRQIKKQISNCYSKMGLIKYDAFDEMAGKLSFVLALLNEDNSGVTLNAMHNRDGCYIYAKEIIKGESYIPLSEEELEAIEKAKTLDEEIKDLTKESNDDMNFDL